MTTHERTVYIYVQSQHSLEFRTHKLIHTLMAQTQTHTPHFHMRHLPFLCFEIMADIRFRQRGATTTITTILRVLWCECVCVCILSIEEKHEWQECRFWSIFKCCIFFVFAKWKTEQRNNTRTQTFFCVLEFPKEEEKSGCKQTKKKDRIFFVKNPYSNQ